MKTMTKQTIALSALIAGLAAVPAMADDAAPYIFGQATHARETNGDKDVANGLGVGLGYKFNRNFAVEGGVTNLKDRPGMSDESANIRAVGIVPVSDKVDVFGKVGMARVGTTLGSSAHDDLTYGVGAGYKLDRNWMLRADYDRLKGASDERQNLFSAGAQYNF